jgi:hypothetical protein
LADLLTLHRREERTERQAKHIDELLPWTWKNEKSCQDLTDVHAPDAYNRGNFAISTVSVSSPEPRLARPRACHLSARQWFAEPSVNGCRCDALLLQTVRSTSDADNSRTEV